MTIKNILNYHKIQKKRVQTFLFPLCVSLLPFVFLNSFFPYYFSLQIILLFYYKHLKFFPSLYFFQFPHKLPTFSSLLSNFVLDIFICNYLFIHILYFPSITKTPLIIFIRTWPLVFPFPLFSPPFQTFIPVP